MKKFISAFLFIILLMCLLSWYFHHYTKSIFRCDTQKMSVLIKWPKIIELNANSTIMISPSEAGIIYITGSIQENDDKYVINRTIAFTMTPLGREGANKTQFTHEEIHPGDNTPENIWTDYLRPNFMHVNFYMEIIPLLHNAVLIKGVNNPYFVCIK
jgi:hypothetical protein